ncbi:MAG: 50S ribosomal protein L29 [Dehalococcoidales bacterium]|nr:50S ribosomal protein L29 [Dehalococcoidales bacterium]MDP6737868.1 50S ribosomal protein L29 [Dehalococcoidales bacterium]
MKTTEMRALNAEELAKQLEEFGRKLLDLRFRLETKQLVNHREIKWAKKDIARLKTIIREKELALR